MSDRIKVKSSALPDSTRVAGFRCTEGISRLYEVDLYVVVDDDAQDLDLSDVINAKGTLEIDPGDDRPPFAFNGIFAAFEMLHHFGTYSVFRATLVPQLWQLTQTLHSRIWTQKSIPDIIKSVLDDSGLSSSDYSLKLSQSYKTEEHVCQYDESNFDFISRWMEREGMYYYFEQGDDAEKLVITDSKSFHGPLGDKPVRYHPIVKADVTSTEALHSFTCRYRSLPASVKYTDYDYTKPTLDVSGSAPVSKHGIGEINVYGSRFFAPDDGKRVAKLRAEELLAREAVYKGKGAVLYLRPGYTFTLEDHPRSAFDMKYLAIECEHTGNQDIHTDELRRITGIDIPAGYWVEVTAIPATVQFRAESKTQWPRIYGYENGTICGPAESEYAQIDDHGRYNVKFKFDESDLKDGKASTWVRMAQPHGGSPEGFHFPLRKGTEVLFTFLGGDPDRPVIAAVVPNTHTPSPVTKGNHTLNVIQTGGRNRFELDDKHGQQRVTLSTPYSNTYIRMGSPNKGHELIVKTDDNTLLDAGQTLTINSGSWREDTVKSGHFNTTVEGTVTDKFDGTHTTTVKEKVTETYNNGQETTVNAAIRKATYNVGQETTVNGAICTETYNNGQNTTVHSGHTLTVTGDQTIDVTATKTETVHGPYNLTVAGVAKVEFQGPTQHIVHGPYGKLYNSDNVNVVYGFKSDTFLGVSNSNQIGASIGVFVGGKVTLEASGAFSATYSYKMDIAGGVALSFKFGAALAINSAVELTVRPTKIETGAAKISQLPTRLAMMALRYHLSGAHVLS